MNREYAMWMHVKNYINSQDTANATIVIGDSRAKAAIRPRLLDGKLQPAMNLSVGGATPIEGYYTLVKYLRNLNPPQNLILSYAPFHLIIDDTYVDRTIKFEFLSNDEYSEVSALSNSIDNNRTLGAAASVNARMYKYDFTNYSGDVLSGIVNWRVDAFDMVNSDLQRSRGHYFFGRKLVSTGLNEETRFETFNYSMLLNDYLVKIVKTANDRNMNVFWFTPPMNQSSCEYLSKEFVDGYTRYIKSFSSYGLKIVNELECWNDDRFGDSSHLYAGAEHATDLLSNYVDRHEL